MAVKSDIDKQVSRSCGTISFHKFQLLKNDNSYAFFFVEGEDDKLFYPSLARGILSDKQVLPLVCGGKHGVKEIFELTKSDLNGQRVVAYFVDRDFDDQENQQICSSIYVTPCYSIENLVFNRETFINILHEKFGLNSSDSEYSKAVSFYECRASEFYSALRLYNGWMYAQRNLPAERKNRDLSFSKNLPDDFLVFSESEIVVNYSLEDIERIHSSAPKISNDELEEALKVIDRDDPESRYRGKFHWRVFSFILSSLIEDGNKKGGGEMLSRKVRFNFSKNDKRKFFEETYHFARMPKCLSEYIENLVA